MVNPMPKESDDVFTILSHVFLIARQMLALAEWIKQL